MKLIATEITFSLMGGGWGWDVIIYHHKASGFVA